MLGLLANGTRMFLRSGEKKVVYCSSARLQLKLAPYIVETKDRTYYVHSIRGSQDFVFLCGTYEPTGESVAWFETHGWLKLGEEEKVIEA